MPAIKSKRQCAHPAACRHRREHHQPDGHQRAEHLKTGHRVKHQQRQKQSVEQAGQPAGIDLQPCGIKGFGHQPTIENRQRYQGEHANARDKQRRIVVHRKNGTKQQMQQIDIRPAQRHQRDAQCQ